MTKGFLLGWLVGTALVAVLFLFFHGPIIQSDVYHNFALDHNIYGIDNAANVLTNVGFLIVGFIGLLKFTQIKSSDERSAPIMLFVLFAGIFLTGMGSAHYHLYPSNQTLFWDRLPMTLVFVSLFSLVGWRYVSRNVFSMVFPISVLLGIFSVLLWQYGGEGFGGGDLRYYVYVQYFPLIAIPIILIFQPWREGKLLWIAFGFYVWAKSFEMGDVWIAAITNIAGHPIKHICASLATVFIYRWTSRVFGATEAGGRAF